MTQPPGYRDPLRRARHAPAGAHRGDPQAAGGDRRQADRVARAPAVRRPGLPPFILATGYKGELIEQFVAEWNGRMESTVECEDTGLETPTGGRIKLLEERLSRGGALLHDLRRRRGRHRPGRATAVSLTTRRAGEHDRGAPRAAIRCYGARRRRRPRHRFPREAALGALDQRRLLLHATGAL